MSGCKDQKIRVCYEYFFQSFGEIDKIEKFYETIVYFIIHTHFGYTLNYNDYLDQTNMGFDFFFKHRAQKYIPK